MKLILKRNDSKQYIFRLRWTLKVKNQKRKKKKKKKNKKNNNNNNYVMSL